MKKFLWMIFLSLILLTPVSAIADVDVKIGINIPPPVALAALFSVGRTEKHAVFCGGYRSSSFRRARPIVSIT